MNDSCVLCTIETMLSVILRICSLINSMRIYTKTRLFCFLPLFSLSPFSLSPVFDQMEGSEFTPDRSDLNDKRSRRSSSACDLIVSIGFVIIACSSPACPPASYINIITKRRKYFVLTNEQQVQAHVAKTWVNLPTVGIKQVNNVTMSQIHDGLEA